jgi:GT2 family glycosyltransferase
MDAITTFIIPTIGRDTLSRALDSLFDQTNPRWKAIVIPDKNPLVEMPEKYQDARITYMELEDTKPKGASLTRNRGLQIASTEWVSFLDDDDCVDKNYVQYLLDHITEHEQLDAVVFRMRCVRVKIMPEPHCKQLAKFHVGISYSLKLPFLRQHGIKFECCQFEDAECLLKCKEKGASILLSKHVVYYVRDAKQEHEVFHDVDLSN